MTARVHPTAIVEDGVVLGEGTSVWDAVHVRGPGTTIGRDCIVGEKTYIAYGVAIGDLVKINAAVYIPTMVTIERGVMVSAGVIFTNDRYPRATTPELDAALPSEPDETTLATVVAEGATIGAGAVIGPGLRIGRFAMIGMGSVVTRPVGDFVLVAGNPATVMGAVCHHGEPLVRTADGRLPDTDALPCGRCRRHYRIRDGAVTELVVAGRSR